MTGRRPAAVGRLRKGGPAGHAMHEALLLEPLQVASNRHLGHTEVRGEALRRHVSRTPETPEELLAASWGIGVPHASIEEPGHMDVNVGTTFDLLVLERTMVGVTSLRVLGIDIGTTNTKAVVVEVSPRGVTEVARAGTPTPSTAAALVAAVLRVVREVLSRAGSPPAAIGIASMAETGVPLDRDGRPLTELLRWDGHRAAREAAVLTAQHGRLELFRATGVRPSAKVPLATLAWLATHEPAVMTRMAGWAGVADLVALALTGDLVTDHTLAGRTMAYRLPPRGEALTHSFDADLLAAVGLRPEHLPRVAPAGDVAGYVRGPKVSSATSRFTATATGPARPGTDATGRRVGLGRFWSDAGASFVDAGLAPGTPVVVAGHDHAVGTWAAGARAAGDRADSLGTAEAVLTVLPDAPAPGPALDAVADAGMSWVRTVSGRHDALLAGSASAGALVQWLVERTATPVAELFAAARADMDHDPRPTGEVVLPYLSGRQSPAPDRAARLHIPEGLAGVRLTRAVLEALCLQARWMLTEQAVLAGPLPAGLLPARPLPARPLTVLGGPMVAGAPWADIKVAVTPGALRWVLAEEPVAAGAALLAATRAGLLGQDVPTLLSEERASSRATSYDGMYEEFVATALRATAPHATAAGTPQHSWLTGTAP